MAARLALMVLVPALAISAVTQVPTFCPTARAAASARVSAPVERAARVMAMAALELCITAVITAPMATR